MEQQEETTKEIHRKRRRQILSSFPLDLTSEQQEETTEEIHRKRRQISSSFPRDLTSEILSKLPAKSLLRFSCVSKLWSSITTDSYFINSFGTQSSTRPSLLVCFRRGARLYVLSIPQHQQNEPCSSSQQHVDIYHTTFPENCCFSFTESVHGLICFRDQKLAKPIIWNPTMRKFLTLPKPEKRWNDITVFLGYDPVEGKHKVVCMPRNKTCDECRVLTLGSPQQSWRSIKTNHKHCPLTSRYGRCINGVLYYEALPDHTDIPIVMSFDVRSEKFSMIQLPSDIIVNGDDQLIPYEGRLACVRHKNNSIKLWILEDVEKHEWSFKHFAVCTFFNWGIYLFSELVGTTDAGEFMFIPKTIRTKFYYYIGYFDTKTNSITKVEFKGIADEELRLCNALGDTEIYPLCTFSNHIESLVSL